MNLKSLLIITLALCAMVGLGWISFQRTETEANIKIDTQEIKEDTGKAIEKGRELIDDAKDAIGDATDDDQESLNDVPAEPDATGDSPSSEPVSE